MTDEPRWGTKEWIRYHWDHELDSAPKDVLMIKLLHEYHIAIPGTVIAILAFALLNSAGLSTEVIAPTALTAFVTGYGIYFNKMWCSTLAEKQT